VTNAFDSLLIKTLNLDQPTRMAISLLCKDSVTTKEIPDLFSHGGYQLHGLP
jgi:hypothetical protein